MRTRFGTVTSLCSNVGLSAAHTVAYTQTLHTDSPHTLYSHALARNASAQTIPAGRQRLGTATRVDHARTPPPPARHAHAPRPCPAPAPLPACEGTRPPAQGRPVWGSALQYTAQSWPPRQRVLFHRNGRRRHHAATSSPRHTVTSITIEEGSLHSAVSAELEQPLVRPGLRKPAPPERGAHLAHHRPRRTVRGG